MFRITLLAICGITPSHIYAQQPTDALQASVQELSDAIGRWHVATDFLNANGSVARSVKGHYEFKWVVPNRVVSGISDIPELEMTSAILFYINESKGTIEMVSVGADGKLWIMTGPLGGNTRTSEPYDTADGGSGQLRFTRFDVTENAFESRMEYTIDGGETWLPGNHQRFQRAAAKNH